MCALLAPQRAREGVRDGDGVRVHALAERGVALDAAEARDDRDRIAVGDAEAPAVTGLSSTPLVWAAPAVSLLMIGIDMFSAKFVSAVLNVIA